MKKDETSKVVKVILVEKIGGVETQTVYDKFMLSAIIDEKKGEAVNIIHELNDMEMMALSSGMSDAVQNILLGKLEKMGIPAREMMEILKKKMASGGTGFPEF